MNEDNTIHLSYFNVLSLAIYCILASSCLFSDYIIFSFCASTSLLEFCYFRLLASLVKLYCVVCYFLTVSAVILPRLEPIEENFPFFDKPWVAFW